MKATRTCLFLLAASLCLPSAGLGQSNAKPDYYHAHKNAEKYQKSQKHLAKERRKQEKAQEKQGKAYLKQHQHQ